MREIPTVTEGRNDLKYSANQLLFTVYTAIDRHFIRAEPDENDLSSAGCQSQRVSRHLVDGARVGERPEAVQNRQYRESFPPAKLDTRLCFVNRIPCDRERGKYFGRFFNDSFCWFFREDENNFQLLLNNY